VFFALHNNYIITNVFNPEIGVKTTNPDILTLINKNVDNREQSYILGAFAEIKKLDPELYYDLIRANFYQTGVVQSPASYYNLLPNTDVVPLANSLLRNHAEITSGKIFPLIDAIMANIGTSLNNVKRVSSKKSDVFSSKMTFSADRSAKKEYIYYKERYDSSNRNAVLREGIFKKVGESSYELLEPQNYRSMFYNLNLSEELDLSYQEDEDTTDENPFIESEEDETPVTTQPTDTAKNFNKKNLFAVTPIQAADKKAIIKASIATQYIGFGEGIAGSSTETYRQQIGEFANTGNYSANDVIFVSIGGKRGTEEQQKTQQDKTIKEAVKAVEAGATILTDNKAYTDNSNYNTGEKKLYANMEAKGYNYSDASKLAYEALNDEPYISDEEKQQTLAEIEAEKQQKEKNEQ